MSDSKGDNIISDTKVLIFVLIFLLVIGFSFKSCGEQKDPFCVSKTTVKDILSINYRDAKLLLDNGETVTVNQSTFKDGDPYCLKIIWVPAT